VQPVTKERREKGAGFFMPEIYPLGPVPTAKENREIAADLTGLSH
jgi:hypothetical protein